MRPYPRSSTGHESQTPFAAKRKAPDNRILLTPFLTRRTTDHPVLEPAVLITLPETEFETVLNTAGPGYTTSHRLVPGVFRS